MKRVYENPVVDQMIGKNFSHSSTYLNLVCTFANIFELILIYSRGIPFLFALQQKRDKDSGLSFER